MYALGFIDHPSMLNILVKLLLMSIYLSSIDIMVQDCLQSPLIVAVELVTPNQLERNWSSHIYIHVSVIV